MANLMLIGLVVQSAFIGTIAWIIRGNCFQYANFSYVKENEVLQGSIIATLPGKSTAECEAECGKEYRCKSINIQIAGEKACELNSENVLDKMANLTLTSKAGWTYKATSYNETLLGVNCKYFKPCAVNHVCVDSCDCPGYICYRCRGIKIGINCLANIVIVGEAVGMESKKITDSQLSVSSVNDPTQDKDTSRLNGAQAWCAKHLNKHQWIKIDLIRRKIITDVAMQSYKNADHIVKEYYLQYSEDTISWQTYEEDGKIKTFVGPTEKNKVKKESLVYYIRAYAVKINPRAWENHLCLRMELYGIDDPWQPGIPADVTGYALGIEDGRIKNYQMSASWRTSNSERAIHGRLNKNTQWCNRKLPPPQQYIRVDFDSRKIITDVAIQGHYSMNYFVSWYNLLYTEDSYEWKTYKVNGVDKLFNGPPFHTVAEKIKLPYWIRAFAIKINPTNMNPADVMCVRMELYGIEDPIQPPIPSGCSNNARPLGIASGALPDSSFSASSSYSNGYLPKYARLNGNRDWCTKHGVAPANTSIQIDLQKSMIVVAVAIQGRFHHPNWVKFYYISYGDTIGNASWIMEGTTKKVFDGSSDNNEIVKNKFDPPIKARYVRLIPKDYKSLICLRMELYGCDLL